jgi:hypothetical protein
VEGYQDVIDTVVTTGQKYKLNYQIGKDDKTHLETVLRYPGVPIVSNFDYKLENGEMSQIEITFDDAGIGFYIPSSIFPGNIWKLTVSSMVFQMPTDWKFVIENPVSRLTLVQLPLSETGIIIKIAKE